MLIVISIILLIIGVGIIGHNVFSEPYNRWFIITYQDGFTGEIKTYEESSQGSKKDCIKIVKDEFMKRRTTQENPINIQIKEVSIDEMKLHLILKDPDTKGKELMVINWYFS